MNRLRELIDSLGWTREAWARKARMKRSTFRAPLLPDASTSYRPPSPGYLSAVADALEAHIAECRAVLRALRSAARKAPRRSPPSPTTEPETDT